MERERERERETHIETQYAHTLSDAFRNASRHIQREASPQTRNASI